MDLRQAIEKIEEMATRADVKMFEINGEEYSSKQLHKIEKAFYSPNRIDLNSLDSLVDIIQVELEKAFVPLFVRIASPTEVEVFSTYRNQDDRYKRDYLYTASAELPNIQLNKFIEHEDFMISLRSKFVETEDVQYLLNLLSKISDKNSVESEDNGLSQTVQAKKGVVMVENVAVRPKVFLAPYRTFLEVDQPASEFLVRLKEGGYIGLFEADGGAWKLDAKHDIQAFLEVALEKEIEDGDVVVIA